MLATLVVAKVSYARSTGGAVRIPFLRAGIALQEAHLSWEPFDRDKHGVFIMVTRSKSNTIISLGGLTLTTRWSSLLGI